MIVDDSPTANDRQQCGLCLAPRIERTEAPLERGGIRISKEDTNMEKISKDDPRFTAKALGEHSEELAISRGRLGRRAGIRRNAGFGQGT